MPRPFNEYLTYQVEDFVADQAFQQWARQPDLASNQFWQQFLQTYPDKREPIEEALEIVSNIQYHPYTLSKEQQDRILQQAYHQADSTNLPKPHYWISNKKHLAVTATITLVLLASLMAWWWVPAYDTYETGYQESRTVRLPDGSEVMLNANTSMRVSVNVEINEPREVWLEGEAYFQVKRLGEQEAKDRPALKNFIVHTDNFDIEVLGTTFNVANRSRKSEVLLKSGKVKVASQQIEQTQILQPGDLLILSEEDKNFQMKKTKADLVPSWRENFFVFENTPLHQVARSLEDYYGLEVTIADQQLATKTFTAKISRDDLPMLLKAIEASFGVSVTREEQAIHIQP
ncbi:MAG: DUF4974 domain-containing protein [Cyclobacteriaceae bacterium]